MVSDALFLALANAEAQPSRGYRAFNAATEAATAPIQGYLQTKAGLADITEKRLKPYEIIAKIAEQNPDAASSVAKSFGIPYPETSPSGKSMDDFKSLLKTNPSAIPPKMRSLVESSTVADSTNNYRDTLASQFKETKGMQLKSKREDIEKDFQNKVDALANAENAITSSLALKQKSGTSGPVGGGLKSIASNFTSGAVSNDVYQLNKNNELWRSALQHAVEVNRFNPQEVGFIGGGALAQPGEPIATSVQKASNAIRALRNQRKQLESERAARLSTLGVDSNPADNSIPVAEGNYDPLGLLGGGNP